MSNAALNLESNDLLNIQPITGRIGAEIRGVKLSAGLDAVTLGAIQDALLRYKVLFFRDQTLDDQNRKGWPNCSATRPPIPPCRCAQAPAACWSWTARVGPIPGIPT